MVTPGRSGASQGGSIAGGLDVTTRAALMLLLSLVAGAAAHLALRRAARRLPRMLARRRGAEPAGPPPTPRALAFCVVVLQTLAWLAATWLATEQFPVLREARREAASIVEQSLMAPLFSADDRSYSTRDLLVLPLLVIGVWVGATGLTRLFRSQVLEAAGVESGPRRRSRCCCAMG
jgi:hypothetical protein